ncbi:MAG: hypothetical protein KC933_15795 [Myxococcales bacterium]|nr:hypothetical protein [Myxococcales bacterium]MCB9673460.1 hypothetical protein [Alphaproteobacteria bacterium]
MVTVDSNDKGCSVMAEKLEAGDKVVVRFAPQPSKPKVKLAWAANFSKTSTSFAAEDETFVLPADFGADFRVEWEGGPSNKCVLKAGTAGGHESPSGSISTSTRPGKDAIRKFRDKFDLGDDIVLAIHDVRGRKLDLPRSISEGERLQVVMVMPQGGDWPDVELTITSCPDPVSFRVDGQARGKAQAARLPPELVPIGRPVSCGAGSLSYNLKVGDKTIAVQVRVRTKTHLTFIVLPGFSFAPDRTFVAERGSVTLVKDRQGASVWAGGMWHPAGVDYEDMQWFNYVLNPFVALKLDDATQSFVVGNGITVSGGLYLSAGLAVTRTREPVGYALGQAFAGDGDVPTRRIWSSEGLGLFLGIGLDSDVYDALSKAFSDRTGG